MEDKYEINSGNDNIKITAVHENLLTFAQTPCK